MSAQSSHQAAASPLSAMRAKPLKGRFRPAGRQIDLASRLSVGPPDLRRDERGRAARGRRRPQDRQGLRSARRGHRASCAGQMADSRPRARRAFGPARNARLRQRRHRLAADDGRGRRARSNRDVRRRRFLTQAADAAHPRPASADGRSSSVRSRGRALSDRAQGRARSRAHRVFDARRLGADQIGRASRRPQRPGRDHRDRKGSLARPHRENARSFRRRGQGRAGGRGTADRTRRPAGIASQQGRRPGRPLFGGVSDRRGADRSGIPTSSSKA